MGYHVCDGRVQLASVLNGLLQLLIDAFGQTLSHYRVVKYIFSKNFCHMDGLAHRFFLLMYTGPARFAKTFSRKGENV